MMTFLLKDCIFDEKDNSNMQSLQFKDKRPSSVTIKPTDANKLGQLHGLAYRQLVECELNFTSVMHLFAITAITYDCSSQHLCATSEALGVNQYHFFFCVTNVFIVDDSQTFVNECIGMPHKNLVQLRCQNCPTSADMTEKGRKGKNSIRAELSCS